MQAWRRPMMVSGYGCYALALFALFVYFKSDRRDGERFGEFCTRKGKEDLERFGAEYQKHGDTQAA